MRILICQAIMAILIYRDCYSQECDPPQWFGRSPKGYAASVGHGPTADSAMNAAWADLFAQLARSKTARIEEKFSLLSGRDNGAKIEEIRNSIKADGIFYDNGAPLFTIMATYQTPHPCGDKGYSHYILVCRSQEGCLCAIKSPSDIGALARSALLPGWGQVYKGRTGRGVIFGSAIALIAGSAIICFPLSDQMYRKAADARTIATREYYSGTRNTLFYAGIGLSISAIVIYGWNLFDARNVEGVPALR